MDGSLMAVAWREVPPEGPTTWRLFEFQCPVCGNCQMSFGLDRLEAQLDIDCMKCGRALSPNEETCLRHERLPERAWDPAAMVFTPGINRFQRLYQWLKSTWERR